MTKDDLLLVGTGHGSAYWVARIQALIWEHVDDPEAVHPNTHVARWMSALATEVEDSLLIDRTKHDENITAGAAVAVILATWAVRIGRAKAHDPRRPVELRRAGAERIRGVAAALADAVFDETQDATYFEQPWEYPFAADATDGDFV